MPPENTNPKLGASGSLETDVCLAKDNSSDSPSSAKTQGKELRPYQLEVIAQLNEQLLSSASTLLVAPTGSGKTLMACELVLARPNNHILWLVHRRELVFHAQGHLKEFGID